MTILSGKKQSLKFVHAWFLVSLFLSTAQRLFEKMCRFVRATEPRAALHIPNRAARLPFGNVREKVSRFTTIDSREESSARCW